MKYDALGTGMHTMDNGWRLQGATFWQMKKAQPYFSYTFEVKHDALWTGMNTVVMQFIQ